MHPRSAHPSLMLRINVAACVLVATATTGCAQMFGELFAPHPGLTTVETYDDGTKLVAYDKLGVAVRAPAVTAVHANSTDKRAALVVYGANGTDQIVLESKDDDFTSTLAQKQLDLEGRERGLSFVETKSFEGGFEIIYKSRVTYKSRTDYPVNYYSVRSVGGRPMHCYTQYSGTMDAVWLAKKVCGSMQPQPVRQPPEATAKTAKR